MKVKKAMHWGVTWPKPGTPIDQLARFMREHDVGAIPIGENDRLVGIVTRYRLPVHCRRPGSLDRHGE